MAYPGTRWNTASGSDTSFGSDVLAQSQTEDLAQAANLMTITSFIAGTSTLTVAQFLNTLLQLTTQAGISLTTPSAAAIVAAMVNAQVGSMCDLIIDNQNSGTMTLVAGAGVTLAGVATTAATTVRRSYKIIVTNATLGAEAVSVWGINILN